MRILFFAESSKSLGHVRRIAILARELSNEFDVTIAANSDVGQFTKRVNFRKVNVSGNHDSGRFPHSEGLKKLVANEHPDCLVFDTFYSVDILKETVAKRIFIMRKYSEKDMEKFMERQDYKLFDLIIVPHERGDFSAYERHFEFLDRCHFVGPIIDIPDDLKRKQHKGLKIVATAGGGGFPDAKRFLEACIDSHDILKLDFTIVPGPMFKDFASLSQHNGLSIIRTADMVLLYLESDIAITQAGYNTINELVITRTPAVIVPAERKNDEQYERAHWLASFGVARVIEIPDAKKIANAVEELAKISREEWERRFRKIPFVPGTRKAAELILKACSPRHMPAIH